jgi:PAS domain S-box-containing protein
MTDIHHKTTSDQKWQIAMQLQAMVANITLPAWYLTGDISGPQFNKAWMQFTGVNLQSATDNNWLDKIHADDRAKCREYFAAIHNAQTRKQTLIEYRLYHYSGEYRWVQEHLTRHEASEGYCSGYIGFIFDIQSSKDVEKALKENKSRYEDLYNSAQIGLYRRSADSEQLLECNEYMARMFEFNDVPDALANFRISDCYLNQEDFADNMRKLKEKGEINNFRGPFLTKKGNKIWLDVSAKSHPDKGYIEGYAYDITTLEESQERVRQLSMALEQSPVSIVVTDIKGNIEFVNPKFTEMTGYAPSEVIGQNPRILKSGHFKADDYENLWDTILSGKTWVGEFLNKKKDGSLFWENAKISPIYSEDGKICHFLAVKEDISERKAIERSLERQLKFTQTLIDSIPTPVFFKDTEHRYIGCNEAFTRILGISKNDVIGKTVLEMKTDTNPQLHYQIDCELLSKGGMCQYESSIMDQNGTLRTLMNFKAVFNDDSGNVAGLIATVVDITEQKLLNESSRNSRDFLHGIIDAIGDPIFVKDEKHCHVLDNDALCKLLGRGKDEMLGHTDRDFLPGNQADVFLERDQKVLTTGIEDVNEEQIINGSEMIRTIVTKKNLYIDPTGKKYIVGVIRDITDLKNIEYELRESEQRYRALFNNLSDAVFVYNESPNGTPGRFIEVNDIACQRLEYSREELLALPAEVLFSSKNRTEKSVNLNRLMAESHIVIECNEVTKSGFEIPVELRSHRFDINGIPTVLVVSHDITIRKKMEDEEKRMLELQQGLTHLLKSLLESSPLDQKLKMITDCVVQLFNADFCRIWLIRPGDLCEKGCTYGRIQENQHLCVYRGSCLHLMSSSGRYTHIDGESHRRVPFGFYKIGLIASGQDHRFLTNDVTNDPRVHNHEWAKDLGLVSFAGYQLRAPSGEKLGVMALFSKQPILAVEDAMLDVLSNAVAIAIQQARNDEILKEREAVLREITNSAQDAILMMDADGKVSFWNSAAESILGYSRKEALGQNVHELLAPQRFLPAHRQAFPEFQKTGQGAAVGKTLELVAVHKDGHEFPVELSLAALQLNGQWCAVGILRDISEQQRNRQRLIQSDKLAAIGTLAAGVAHEINNPIGYVNSNLNTMAKYVSIFKQYCGQGDPQDQEERQKIHEIIDDFESAIKESMEGISRVRKIVTDLKTFSRADRQEKEFADINEGIESTLNIVWNELKYKCRVEKDLGRLPKLFCIPNQINQVIMNMLVNASQAVNKEGGLINIKTWFDMGEIFISIKDNGQGIPEQNLKRIFEPFFTTKEVGKGTGLGFSLAYDIVKNHDGKIEVISEVGKGTEFIISFPAKETDHVKS